MLATSKFHLYSNARVFTPGQNTLPRVPISVYMSFPRSSRPTPPRPRAYVPMIPLLREPDVCTSEPSKNESTLPRTPPSGRSHLPAPMERNGHPCVQCERLGDPHEILAGPDVFSPLCHLRFYWPVRSHAIDRFSVLSELHIGEWGCFYLFRGDWPRARSFCSCLR